MIYFIADQNAKGHVTLKINTIASTFPLRLTRLFKFSFLMPKGRVMQVSFNWYRIYWLVKFNQKKEWCFSFLNIFGCIHFIPFSFTYLTVAFFQDWNLLQSKYKSKSCLQFSLLTITDLYSSLKFQYITTSNFFLIINRILVNYFRCNNQIAII